MCQLETIHIHQPLSPDAVQRLNPLPHFLQTIGVDVIVEDNGLCREASMIMEYEKPAPPQVTMYSTLRSIESNSIKHYHYIPFFRHLFPIKSCRF